MPYWATRDDGELVISQDFLEPDWKTEKDRARKGEVVYTCPDCGEHLHLVTIGYRGRRTQFFRHDPDMACERENNPESLDHVRLKKAVFDICRDFGWQADVEVAGSGYIADVLAWSRDRWYAFEVQLSPQSGEVLADRSERYWAAGITPVWLLASFPAACPFVVPRQAFGVWERVRGGTVPDYEMRDERWVPQRWATIEKERGLQLVRKHLWRQKNHMWYVPQVIAYWIMGGAIVATFEDSAIAANPRVRLWGRTTTLADVVIRALTGEIGRDFDRAMDRRIAERDELAVRADRATRAMTAGVIRDFEDLRSADRERFELELAALEAGRIARESAEAERRREEAARRLARLKEGAVRAERDRCRREDEENDGAVTAYWAKVERERRDQEARIARETAAEQERRLAGERAARERARRAAWAEMRTTEGFWWVSAAVAEWDRKVADRLDNEVVEAESRAERERVKAERARRDAALKAHRASLEQQTKQVRLMMS